MLTELSTMEDTMSIPDDANEEARQRKTYASFGNDGVTATVNAYGNIMHITRYFGKTPGNPSGFMCAETSRNGRVYPYHAMERLKGLDQASVNPNIGLRLAIDGGYIHSGDKTKLSFVHNRWPFFQNDNDFSIQYTVHKDTVYQTYTFKLSEAADPENPVDVDFSLGVRLLDLNFTKNGHGFQEMSAAEKQAGELSIKERLAAKESVEDQSTTELLATEQQDQLSSAQEISDQEQSDKDEMIDDYLYQNSSDDDSVRGSSTDGNSIRHSTHSRSPAYRTLGDVERNCRVWLWEGLKPAGSNENLGLFVSPFVGDRHQRTFMRNGAPMFTIDATSWKSSVETGKLEITFAYTLKFYPFRFKHADWLSPVSENDVRDAKEVLRKPYEILRLNDDSHLNFVLWRNIEHILSVCSIPVCSQERSFSDELPPYVLTCGDISGHRILTKASFHAFRLLLSALKQLAEKQVPCKYLHESCVHGTCKSYWRIWRICQGHIVWLCDNWAANLVQEKQALEGNRDRRIQETHQRWASGETINGPQSNAWLSQDVYTDTPLQIIKIGEFVHWAKNKLEPSLLQKIRDSLTPVVSFWLKHLSDAKKNGFHIFPRSRNEMPNKFYFVDHAVIWWALKMAEVLELQVSLEFDSIEISEEPVSTSREFQLNIFRRFIIDKPVVKWRMLSMSRSISETGFVIDVEDTTLFYAADWGLFTDGTTQNMITSWKNTENSQRHRPENEDFDWENPVQFALAMILTSRGCNVNAMAPGGVYAYAKSVLLKASSPNGLLAGQMDLTQSPVVYDRKEAHDVYWSATFETPYILWNYPLKQKANAKTTPSSFTPELQQSDLDSGKIETSKVFPSSPISKRVADSHTVAGLSASRNGLIMKRRLPFGYDIDQANIVEMTDDWLYDEPTIFGISPDLSQNTIREFCKANLHGLGQTAVEYLDRPTPDNNEAADGPMEDIKGIIVDIPIKNVHDEIFQKTTAGIRQVQTTSTKSNVGLSRHLGSKRVRKDSKKRILQLFQANPVTFIICCLASAEKDEMITFFNRHGNYQKHFFENAVSNKWVTELHLSFWDLSAKSNWKNHGSFPPVDEIPFPTSKNSDQEAVWVGRTVTSFRFDGDFLDRYWTCHFLEHNAANGKEGMMELDVTKKSRNCGTQTEHGWQQRRILELVLFDRALKSMIDAAEEILKKGKQVVQQSLDPKQQIKTKGGCRSTLTDALTVLEVDSNETYLSASKLCNKVRVLLQAIQDDLDGNLRQIKAWSERGNSRRAIRWTRKDERRYRRLISEWETSNNHRIIGLEQCRANIESYVLSLARNMEGMRSVLEIRGSEDIRLFTYVTAIFLPLGFATGIFSMSEAPSSLTLRHMIITSVVALLLTFVALLNAKFLEKWIVKPVIGTYRWVFAGLFRILHDAMATSLEKMGLPRVMTDFKIRVGWGAAAKSRGHSNSHNTSVV